MHGQQRRQQMQKPQRCHTAAGCWAARGVGAGRRRILHCKPYCITATGSAQRYRTRGKRFHTQKISSILKIFVCVHNYSLRLASPRSSPRPCWSLLRRRSVRRSGMRGNARTVCKRIGPQQSPAWEQQRGLPHPPHTAIAGNCARPTRCLGPRDGRRN